MENQKQKKSVGTVLLVILLLIVTIASLILATYAWAKYTTQTEGTATAQVAKWNVGVNFENKDFEETYDHILDGRLAPGSSGSFDIKINPGQTEVDFDYEIMLVKTSSTDGNVPEHLHFYIIDTTTGNSITLQKRTANEIGVGSNYSEQPEAVKEYLKARVDMTDQKNTDELTKTIYWEWPYENPDPSSEQGDSKGVDEAQNNLTDGPNGIPDYDDQDTLDGIKAGTVKVEFKVTATQVDPNEE